MLCWGKALYILNKTPTHFLSSMDCTTHLCAAHTLLLQFAAGFGSFFKIQKLKIQNGVTGVTDVCQILLNGL